MPIHSRERSRRRLQFLSVGKQYWAEKMRNLAVAVARAQSAPLAQSAQAAVHVCLRAQWSHSRTPGSGKRRKSRSESFRTTFDEGKRTDARRNGGNGKRALKPEPKLRIDGREIKPN
jgi:hypothetical protein